MDNNLLRSADIIGMFCRVYMSMKRDFPIRSSEMGVLIYVSRGEGLVTPLMISHFFKITKPSVSSVLTSLIKLGYLEKVLSEIDKRSYTIRLSDKGKSLVELTFNEYFDSIVTLESKMGVSEFSQFIELMTTANKILEENN